MSDHVIERRFQFAMGHRVFQHESKCRHLHGHNYVLWAIAKAAELDALGRVIDFGVLKERIGSWLDAYWDHGFMLFARDEEAIAAVAQVNATSKLYVLERNPTAENIAEHFVEDVAPRLMAGTTVRIIGCRLEETENCVAEYRLRDWR